MAKTAGRIRPMDKRSVEPDEDVLNTSIDEEEEDPMAVNDREDISVGEIRANLGAREEEQDFDRSSEEATLGMSLREALKVIDGLDPGRLNKNGQPDLRLLINRQDPKIVAAFNVIKSHQEGLRKREPGRNLDGSLDMRIAQNRDNPEVVKLHYSGKKFKAALLADKSEGKSDKETPSERRLRRAS